VRRVTRWVDEFGVGELFSSGEKSGDLQFAVDQIQKYGATAFIKDEIVKGERTGKRAVFRTD